MKLRIKRCLLTVLGLVIVLAALAAPFQQKAQAAGEDFAWEDSKTIIACGGDFASCGVYKQYEPGVGTGLPTSNGEYFMLSQPASYKGCTLSPGSRPGLDTSIRINTDNRTGTAYFGQSEQHAGGGDNLCPRGQTYPTFNITIRGDRGLSGTQPATIQLLTVAQNAPGTIGGSVKAGASQPISAPSIASQTASRQNAARGGYLYEWKFSLDAGKTFTFCFGSFYPGCFTFTMGNGPYLKVFGETAEDRRVTVRAGTNMSGIFNAVIRDPSGAEVGRNNSGPNTIANNRIQEVHIENIPPGFYTACLINTSNDVEFCEPFEKQEGQSIIVQVNNEGQNSGEENEGPILRCEASIFNPLTWLICPLVAAAQGAVNSLNGAIDSLLTVDTDPIFNDSTATGKAFHTAWSNFRGLALGVIVIAALVMVISQAAGIEILDAYTIRKVLPRLVVATIFITLSWPVLEFLISLTNDVGNGIRSLIYTPFKGIGQGGITLDMSDQLGAALIGAPVIMALGLLALGSFVITAFFAVLIGFCLLFLREAVIMFLVLIAPLAIACSILPNTQKFWDFWKNTLISMLLVFPIISGFIALCRVFAVVFYNA